MKEEIKQNGRTVLSSTDGFSMPMFFNNLCGKNFSGEKYRDYIRDIGASSPEKSRCTVTANKSEPA